MGNELIEAARREAEIMRQLRHGKLANMLDDLANLAEAQARKIERLEGEKPTETESK